MTQMENINGQIYPILCIRARTLLLTGAVKPSDEGSGVLYRTATVALCDLWIAKRCLNEDAAVTHDHTTHFFAKIEGAIYSRYSYDQEGHRRSAKKECCSNENDVVPVETFSHIAADERILAVEPEGSRDQRRSQLPWPSLHVCRRWDALVDTRRGERDG